MISAYKSTYGQDRRIAECHSSILDIDGVIGLKQKCSMTSQKSFIFSEPAPKENISVTVSLNYSDLGFPKMYYAMLFMQWARCDGIHH